jgi:7-cyano-7-deazaguanine synthase
MAALMERPRSATGIAIGIHAGTAYPDCSPLFVDRMQAVYDLYTSGRVKIVAPFLEWSKGEILAYACSSGVPLGLTYSCEAGSEPPCECCRSCLDRKLLDE